VTSDAAPVVDLTEDGQGRRRAQRREMTIGLAFVLPALLLVLGVYLIPMLTTIVYSVTRIDIGTYTIDSFVGIGNFQAVMRNEFFADIVLRTLYFGGLVSLLTLTASLLFALHLNQSFRGRTFVQVVVLLPWAVPPVVSGVVWNQMFQPEFGFLNTLARSFGLESGTIWLGSPGLALHSLVVVEVWRWIPFATLFLLAGLKTIPSDVYEAAAVDGATLRQRFRLVTMPLLAPQMIPVAIFLFVWAMKAFDTIFVLTRGGPRSGTTTMNYLVYQQGFEQFRFGRASASAFLLTAMTLVIIAALGTVLRLVKARSEGVR
jgi:multiple sugar transport system permease protein